MENTLDPFIAAITKILIKFEVFIFISTISMQNIDSIFNSLYHCLYKH